MPKQTKKPEGIIDTWELESDASPITIEDLIKSPPFNQTSDESGESVTVGTRIPQWLLRRIAKIREMPGAPYEINSDVLRDAIYLGMQILQLRYKQHDWAIEQKLVSVIDATGALARITSQVNELCKHMEKMHSDEDDERAVSQLDGFICATDSVRDDWHKRTIIRLLKRRGVVNELLPRCSRKAREIML